MIDDRAKDVLTRFDYHSGKNGNSESEELRAIREGVQQAAAKVLEYTPSGREQALAITQLEQAYMWAVAAFCRSR
jgi:hypothetical protein